METTFSPAKCTALIEYIGGGLKRPQTMKTVYDKAKLVCAIAQEQTIEDPMGVARMLYG